MMPRIMLVVLLAMGMGTTASLAGQVCSDPQTEQRSHTVIKGDTLWDIAGKYYRNPWEWRRVWEANRSLVKNPDLIEPAQVLVIPGAAGTKVSAPAAPAVPVAETKTEKTAAAVPALETKEIPEEPAEEKTEETGIVVSDPEPAVEPVPVPAVSPEPGVSAPSQGRAAASPPAAKRYFEAEGMTVPKDWKADGYIIGEKDKKYLISQGDTVYLNLGADRVRPGTQLMVYRRFDKLHDPKTGDFLGYEVRRIGRLEVTTSIEPASSTAKVITSYEPIENGDMVKILGAE